VSLSRAVADKIDSPALAISHIPRVFLCSKMPDEHSSLGKIPAQIEATGDSMSLQMEALQHAWKARSGFCIGIAVAARREGAPRAHPRTVPDRRLRAFAASPPAVPFCNNNNTIGFRAACLLDFVTVVLSNLEWPFSSSTISLSLHPSSSNTTFAFVLRPPSTTLTTPDCRFSARSQQSLLFLREICNPAKHSSCALYNHNISHDRG